jgi:hypothetical protein
MPGGRRQRRPNAGHLGDRPLIESWDGTQWLMRHAPAVSGVGYLAAVACPSSSSRIAVGGFGFTVIAHTTPG